jgi:hypothetical protein
MRAIVPLLVAGLLGVAFTTSLNYLSPYPVHTRNGPVIAQPSGLYAATNGTGNRAVERGQDLQTVGSILAGGTLSWDLLAIVVGALILALTVSIFARRVSETKNGNFSSDSVNPPQ